MDECAGLENRRVARLRGFESLSLRQFEVFAEWAKNVRGIIYLSTAMLAFTIT